MNITEITMESREADRAFREYRDVLKREHTQADAWLCRVYRRLKRNGRVLNIADAFRATGLDEKGRPLLAMMRADKSECVLSANWSTGDLYFYDARHGSRGGRNVVFNLRKGWFGMSGRMDARGRHVARLPQIPPRFRPPQEKLKNYWLLWEAAWESLPVDPFLLRPLGGPFYAIVAQWDLTAAERAVLDFTRSVR